MPTLRTLRCRRQAAWLVAFLLVLAGLGGPAPAQESAAAETGDLWLLRQYRVPGCEPMPRLPTVFNWLIRKALAVEEFIATSADCGQATRRGAVEGWTYIFWSETDDTAIAKLLQRGEDRFGITRLVALQMDETFTVHSQGYEPFVMLQLGGAQGPARIWAAGDIASLTAEITLSGPGEFTVGVESLTHGGRRCSSSSSLRPDEQGGPREALPCRPGG